MRGDAANDLPPSGDAPKPSDKPNGRVNGHATGDSAQSAAVEFLRVHSPIRSGVVVSFKPTHDSTQWIPARASEVEKFIQKFRHQDVYFVLGIVKDGVNDQPKKQCMLGSNWLWLDLDPRPNEDEDKERDRILRKLTIELPPGVPPPTMIIDSGRGYWALWLLVEPCMNTDLVEAHNRALANLFDAFGDDCWNCNRVGRLPGTINQKTGRTARVVQHHTDRKYSLAQMPTPSAGASSNAKAPGASAVDLDTLKRWNVADDVRTVIEQGVDPSNPNRWPSRSEAVMYVVCALVRCGVPDDTVLNILLDKALGISDSVFTARDGRARARPIEYAQRQLDRAHQKAAEDTDPVLQLMNSRHALICNYGDRVRVMTEQHDQPPLFQAVHDFKNRYLNEPAPVNTRETRAQFWLKHPRCRKYDRAEFLPGKDTEPGVLNLWSGWTVQAAAGNCSNFLALVKDVVCAGNEQLAEWLFDWMAHTVQRPHEPGEVAVVLRGGQGIGKSFFAEHFGELFDRHFVPLTDPKHVVGNFNAILQLAVLVFADEAFAANDKRTEGILKGLVTQGHLTIEPKGVDAFKAPKFLRLFLASNKSWVVPADMDDRRFLVLDVSETHKKDRPYFRSIDAEWKSGGREAFKHFLMNRDISNFDHRDRPETAALADQKLHSLRGAKRIVYEMLVTGADAALKVDGYNVFIATREVLDRYSNRCSEKSLSLELARIARGRNSIRETCDGKQRRGYWLPSLLECRKAWAEAAGITPNWPSDDGQWESVQSREVLM